MSTVDFILLGVASFFVFFVLIWIGEKTAGFILKLPYGYTKRFFR